MASEQARLHRPDGSSSSKYVSRDIASTGTENERALDAAAMRSSQEL